METFDESFNNEAKPLPVVYDEESSSYQRMSSQILRGVTSLLPFLPKDKECIPYISQRREPYRQIHAG